MNWKTYPSVAAAEGALKIICPRAEPNSRVYGVKADGWTIWVYAYDQRAHGWPSQGDRFVGWVRRDADQMESVVHANLLRDVKVEAAKLLETASKWDQAGHVR
jgi:hypothetical protein